MKNTEERMWLKLSGIQNWDDWILIEQEFFNQTVLIPKSAEEWCHGLERSDIITPDNIVWQSTSIGYKNRDLYFLYEKARLYAFAKLEPDAAKENSTHPERYGQICNLCELWTRSHEPNVCAFCSNELLPFPLNED